MSAEDRSLVSAASIINILSQRDLERCIQPSILPEQRPPYLFGRIKLYEPRFWNKAGYWLDRWVYGRKESPTYKAVTGRMNGFQLLMDLAQKNAIQDRSVQDLADGWLRITAIDQLAISQLPEEIVLRLDRDGFGFWPVLEGLTIEDVNLDKFKCPLTDTQKTFLSQIFDGRTRSIGGLWFQDERLTADKRPVIEDYIPTAVEVLNAFETFYDQEGFYPHSQGRWFYTSTQFPVSFKEEFKRIFDTSKPRELFFQMCIAQSPEAEEIRYNLSRLGDFESHRDEGGWARKKGDRLSLTDYAGRMLFERRGENYLWMRKSDEDKLEFKGDVLTIRDYGGRLIGRFQYKTVIAEFLQKKEATRIVLEEDLPVFVVARSDRKHGVALGVSKPALLKNSGWSLADGAIVVYYLEVMSPFLSKKAQGLPVIDHVRFPRIFPDQHAGYLYQ